MWKASDDPGESTGKEFTTMHPWRGEQVTYMLSSQELLLQSLNQEEMRHKKQI